MLYSAAHSATHHIQNMNDDATMASLRYIIDNVFLPPKVPDREESNIPGKDSDLIVQVSHVATLFKDALCEDPHLPAETKQAWEIVCRMLKKMQTVRPGGIMTKYSIETGLGSMKVGGKHLFTSTASIRY
jgi:hypothetical protein